MKPYKIACVFTSMSPVMLSMIEDEFEDQMKVPYTLINISAGDVFHDMASANPTAEYMASEMIKCYSSCLARGADVILNVCSSVGEIAAVADTLFELSGIKIFRIDEPMGIAAAARHARIGVIGTVASTLGPSVKLVEHCFAAVNKKGVAVPFLLENSYGLDKERLAERVVQLIAPHADKYDAFILAQLSMALSAPLIENQIGKPVYSSVKLGVAQVAKHINEKALTPNT